MKLPFIALSLLLVLLSSCVDPITVGSELLEGDRATVGQVVDLPFTTRVVREDSLLTYNAETFIRTRGVPAPLPVTFGQIEDPNFGTTIHSVYLTPRLPITNTGAAIVPPFINQAGVDVDSIVVLLPIDTLQGFYGPGRTFPYQVLRMEARPLLNQNYYTTFDTAVSSVNLGFSDRFTGSLDEQLVRDTSIRGDTVEQAHVRIRLNQTAVDQFNGFTSTTFVDSVFYDLFPGIYLTPTAASDALIYLAPSGVSSQAPVYSGFNVYYTDTSGRAAEYRIPFLQALPNYTYNYTGSFVETLLDRSPATGLMAVQGRGGLMTEIRFNDLSALEGRVINRAEMELTVADIVGIDYEDFPPPSRLEFFYRDPAFGDQLTPIIDRQELLRGRALNPVVDFFLGGVLRNEDGVDSYSPAFSIHLQRMVRGEVPREVYLRVYTNRFNVPYLLPANRAVLNGPTDADRPARVRVTFTDIN